MKVIELIIDGFKSYAVRTVITGWDESFNSITGLNGSGKSNILDAICFVLGITNMSTVRAQNLQELIYKRGQAGVTKASVTIVFDNKDKLKSPIGFEEHDQISVTRQIVLGGTSKYLINGHRAQQHTVQNLFQSVQLNINNPNFLIMQGRITKVLNMKPAETLAMIEEAAGTRMFEERRDKAFKTMAKKETKVQELTALLQEEIEPKLEKLRQEKRAFLDFQQTQSDLERTSKLVLSHDYMRSTEKAQQVAKEIEDWNSRNTALEESAERLRSEIAFLNEDLQKVKTARDKEVRKGGKFQALEMEVKAKSHEVERLDTIADLKNVSMEEEAGKQEALRNDVERLSKEVQVRSTAFEDVEKRHSEAHNDLRLKQAEANQKEELLQTLQTGVASREGQETGYQAQLQDAKDRVSTAETTQEQAKLKIAHLEKRIKEEEPNALKAKKENSGLLKDLEALRSQAKKLETELQKMGFDPERALQQQQEQKQLQQKVQVLQDESDEIRGKVSNIDFNYTDPSPDFDRSRVKGLLAQLFTLKRDSMHAATALEICAGGRLYNVVVDNEKTGSELLQKGQLKKRVTIIPLNKISAFKASAERLGAAKKLAPGKVDLALSLVGYDKEVTSAMEFVFGSTLVCADGETAKKVTFDQAVKLRSVTLEGDVYDPSGTLSGGSAPQSTGVLVTLQKLNEVTRELQSCIHTLSLLQAESETQKKKHEQTQKLKQELDLKTHETSLMQQQIDSSSAASILQAVEEMKETITAAKAEIAAAKVRHTEASKDIKRVEEDIKEFSGNKDGKLAELQRSLGQLKMSLSQASDAIKPLQRELRTSKVELEQCNEDLIGAQEALHEMTTALQSQRGELSVLKAEQDRAKRAFEIAQAELDDERAKLTGYDDEVKSLEDVIQAKAKQISDEALDAQKLGHQMDKLQKDQTMTKQTLAQLESEYEWILEEKNSFGKPGTPYDYRGYNMPECRSSLKTLTDRFQGMKRKINPKVMNMIDSVEKKEAALKQMMRTVVRDKKKIEETIESLDEYKKEALHKTWSKVNGDFGQIFNELLPGSFAKLDPLEGKSIAEGLDIKVSLGKVWKQSLVELSGGQRSLVALSLIMALLQFKPAPMYILDEVDAALDLSHTQNIGRLIKTRFVGSQFIVVSLKDGMFQNANRIFRTRFSEGTSVVQALTPADMR